ncbi:MAG: heavy-metal-associated domain-containing protein, partial [marine benthic group bacterium]|nr:heavy-metal-associated domain-containing protein [Gemmatimonadota bacterium]
MSELRELTEARPEQVEFRVEDMDCASCMATIRSALERQSGFEGLEGSTVSRRLEVRFDAAKTDAESLRRVIGDLGYRALQIEDATVEPVRIWRSHRAKLTYLAGGFFVAGIFVRL